MYSVLILFVSLISSLKQNEMLKSALLIKQRKIVEGHMYKIVLSQTKMVWFGLVYDATFNNISVISCMVVNFIGGGNLSSDYPKKTINL
jgi:hypothetical protein